MDVAVIKSRSLVEILDFVRRLVTSEDKDDSPWPEV